MNKLLLKLAILAAMDSLLSLNPIAAQVSQTTRKAASVRITKEPEVELSKEHLTIIRWTTNNPGGTPVHYGMVRYGTDPKDLSQVAKSPIRVNPSHPSTVFRVRMEGLKPNTTYYYTVSTMESNGTLNGLKSTVKQFTTPAKTQAAGR
jgi:hypothetical protein